MEANAASFDKAAAAADRDAPAFMDLVDLGAEGAWPIVGADFVLVPDNPTPEKVQTLRNTFDFFEWAFRHGVAVANESEVPEVPGSAHKHIHEAWRRAKEPSGRPDLGSLIRAPCRPPRRGTTRATWRRDPSLIDHGAPVLVRKE